MTRLLLTGGHVCCPQSGVDGARDLLLDGDRVAGIFPPGEAPGESARALDVSGAVVLPGAIDLCATLRDPGREQEEPLQATLQGAARGGFCTVLGLANTTPCPDQQSVLRALDARARAQPQVPELRLLGALTKGRAGEELAELGELSAEGAAGFADLPRQVTDSALMRRAMEYAATFDRPVFSGAPNTALARGGVIAEGRVSTRLGLAAVPEAAEVVAVARDIELARLSGARLHLGPITTARSLRLVEQAAREGVAVTTSTTVAHLLLNEQAHLERPYDTALRLWPPLRTEADRRALAHAVQDGTLSLMSGHAPVGPAGKELEFCIAEPGASLIELALPLVADLPPAVLANAWSVGPAAALGLTDRGHLREGARADVTVLRRAAPWRIEAAALASPSPCSPFLGATAPGSVALTVVAGAVAWSEQ